MKRRRSLPYFAIGLMLIVAAALHFTDGKAAAAGVPLVLLCALAVCTAAAHRYRNKPVPTALRPNTEVSLPRIFQKQASDEAETADPAAMLGRERRKQQLAATEEIIDRLLDEGIQLIRLHLSTHTVAVFFPTNDGGYRLRRYASQSRFINKEAVIYPGVGVIGSFLKDGLKRLNLKEIISDSMTLYYYTHDAGIRSLMASPIVYGGAERGTVIVDSTIPNSFTDDDHAFLSAAASLLGEAVFSRYLHTEHKLQHGRLAAMSSIEKDFFRNLSRQSIIDRIMEIIPCALPCDRLTLSMKNDDGVSATLLAAAGPGSDAFVKKSFSLREKSLASVLYANNLLLWRNYSKEHYEVRYFAGEPRNSELLSFVAVPLGVDVCRGMLLAESYREDAYDESYRELLGRLSTSAGLALEKMLVFEKANALATHDGLTGLCNHRTFQQILSDEITRAIRYNEPVALVIADIDFFKKINDTYGHQFGDTVLRGVAGVLENSIRMDIDTIARYGGEEFAIILVKTDDKGAAETAERIRSTIASTPFRAPTGNEVRITMSFGIAQYRKHARNINELIARADKALYRAKEGGRNRTEIF